MNSVSASTAVNGSTVVKVREDQGAKLKASSQLRVKNVAMESELIEARADLSVNVMNVFCPG